MTNNKKQMSVAEAVAHSFPLRILQEAVRIREAGLGYQRDLTNKIDPFDTPFDDNRDNEGFDRTEV